MSINQVAVGETFQLVVEAFNPQDPMLRATSAYFDLLFDESLASVTSIDFGDRNFSLAGTPGSTGLDNIGAADIPLVEPRVFTLELQATAEGTFTADGADGFVTLIGTNEFTAPSFTSDSLTIVPEPSAFAGLALGTLLLLGVRTRK